MKIPSLLSDTFALIPLRGKSPVPQGWPSTAKNQYTTAELEKGNYGVIVGDAHLVVDVDPRNFAPGDKPLARLVAATGGAAAWKTFTVRTGGGGLHLYFALPAAAHGTAAVNQLKEYMGVEFKTGTGRQVVGPGSIHPDTGKEYVVAVDTAIAPIPPALLSLIASTHKDVKNNRGEKSQNEKGKNENGEEPRYDDHEAAQGRYISYLENCAPLAVEGQNGDNTAYKVAAAGRDLGLSAEICLALMDAHWSARCSPPWEIDELAVRVRHAYKYGKREVGNASPARDFTALGGGAGAGGPSRPAAAAVDRTDGRGGTGSAASGGALGGHDAGDGIGGDAASLTWELDRDGKVKKTFHNLMNYMKMPRTDGGLWKVFGFNDFTGQVEFLNPAPWHRGKLPHGGTGGSGGMIQDHDLKLLKGYLVSKFGLEMPIGAIEEAVTNVAHMAGCRFHPVREYLDSLKGTWDGKPRIDTWLIDYAGVKDTPYTRAVARKTLCAAVKRIYHPGCKFDHILVLEGAQAAGKSQLVEALAGRWSADFSIDPSNKDTVDAMQGKWIVEMAEMSVLNRAEMAALKAFITRRIDRVRQAYGRLTREFPRQSIFIGSINPEGDGSYLTDSTGNRRFWPVEAADRIDFAGIRRDRNQLFAEAIVKAENEVIYMENEDLAAEARAEVSERHAEDPWTERIAAWLREATGVNGAQKSFVTAREIFVDALGGVDKNFARRDMVRIANVMRAQGWTAGVHREGEVVVRGYLAPGREKRGKKAATVAPAPDSLDGLL